MIHKEKKLIDWLRQQERVAVAFSGGVDSAYLAWAAFQALGEQALAVTACAHSYPRRELVEAEELAGRIGIAHEIFSFDEFQVEGFAKNPPDRCYFCKSAILIRIKEIAKARGIACIVEGSNKDDEGDYRPGMRAVEEQGVYSPLRVVGLTKEEIRQLSRRAGLPTWDKQSAACLASRVAYGELITLEKLRMTEQAEEFLRDLGIKGQLRVRVHGDLARLELPEESISDLLKEETKLRITEALKKIGFTYVTVDLQGYRVGSMNEGLRHE